MFRASIVALALLLGSFGTSLGAEACKLSRLMKIDMTRLDSRRVTVPMTIDGHAQRMLVDTGGLLTSLSEGAISALGLPRKRISVSAIEMFGNKTLNGYASAQNIALGSWTIPSLELLAIPDASASDGADGLLAPDLLHLFDVDFDFAGGKLSFFSPDHCDGKVVYWTNKGFSRVDISLDEMNHINTMVELDGQAMRAVVDTGASGTVLSLEQAERLFGIDEKAATQNPLPANKGAYFYNFKTLTIQGVTVSNPNVILVSNDAAGLFHNGNARGRPNMILGMNILSKLHLYVAYREKALYVTPANAD